MTKPSTPYKEILLQELADPKEAAGLLGVALEEYEDDPSEENKEVLFMVLQDIAQAGGKVNLDFSRPSDRQKVDRALASNERSEASPLKRLFDLLGLELKGIGLEPKHAPAT